MCLSNFSLHRDLVDCCEEGSASSIHYLQVYNDTDGYIYGRNSALHDRIIMRLKLGYKYYWELARGVEPMPCNLCARPGAHTLQHYVLQCPSLAEFRPQGQWDLSSMVCFLINNDIIPKIMRKYPKFAPRW